MRRKRAEKLPADLLLGFNRAVKSKAESLLESQKPDSGSVFGGKVKDADSSRRRGGGRKRMIKSLREER